MNDHTSSPQFQLVDLIKGLDVVIKGDEKCIIQGVSSIQEAQTGHITFLTNSLYRKHLKTTKASAVILLEKDAKHCSVNAVITTNPHYVYAKIATFFDKSSKPPAGIHPSVVVGINSEIDPSASIAPYCVIGNQVKIAPHVTIGAGTILGDFVEIAEATCIDARVTVYDKVKIGKRSRVTSGAVIGSDGFGFANQKGKWHKVPQLGSVEIGDDVDIGANTTIDRGTIENTIIEDGVKLDNLIQVGHNVRIGAHTIIAGCVGIAGSATIGKSCMIGGATIILGHITIADNVCITGGSGVSKSIHEAGVYSSGVVGIVPSHEFRKNNARFHRLENLFERVKKVELILKEATEERKKS